MRKGIVTNPKTIERMINMELDPAYAEEIMNDLSLIRSGTPTAGVGMGSYYHHGEIVLRAAFYGGMSRDDGLTVIGILNHEVMHKILHRLIDEKTCSAYDKIWSMHLDHDFQNGTMSDFDFRM